MEAAAISDASEAPESAGLTRLAGKRTVILDELDKQLSLFSDAAAVAAPPSTGVVHVVPSPTSEIVVPHRSDDRTWRGLRNDRGIRIVAAAAVLFAALGLSWFGAPYVVRLIEGQSGLTGKAAVEAVVERIIDAESKGSPGAKNKNSSATGFGQFIDDTWLEMIRKYRPDLAKGRSKDETLELRRETKLAHEITTRFAERNAALLKRRGLPVTAGNIYLAHFAGGAGAVAILAAAADADAALTMANADASGRTKREQIVKANPFLGRFTVADLKLWADRKMRGQSLHLTELLSAGAKK